MLVHNKTNPLVIHEREQSAHCREKDTGGTCGVTGDVGVKTSDSVTCIQVTTNTLTQFSTMINIRNLPASTRAHTDTRTQVQKGLC